MTLRNASLFAEKNSKSKTNIPRELQALIDDPTKIDLTWVKNKKCQTSYIFVSESIEIDADPQTVFEEVKKVHRYHDISQGAVTVHAYGEVVPGNKIKIELYKDKFKGKFIPPVTETIIVAGKVNKDWVIGWGLPLPFGKGFTERYQILEALPDHRTRSTIADKIPGVVGLYSYLTMNKIIKNSFEDLNTGLKRQFESTSTNKTISREISIKWTIEDIPDLKGVAIVTGASSGLGWEVTRRLAEHGMTVVMACRDTNKAEIAKRKILQLVPQANLIVEQLDLSELQSIRRFCQKMKSSFQCVNLLINNAATLNVQGRTKDGFELIFGTNYLGTFALTAELLPLLEISENARILTVGSDSHKFASIEFNEFETDLSGDCLKAYARSKLANLLFAFELNRRLQKANKNIISLAAHPGFSKSHLSDANSNSPSAVFSNILAIGMSLFAQPTEQGALPLLYAATAKEAQGGDYIGPDGLGELRGYPKISRASNEAYSEEIAKKLWEISEQKLEKFGFRFDITQNSTGSLSIQSANIDDDKIKVYTSTASM